MALAVSDDGNFEFTLLTQEYLEAALDVIRKSLFTHANICVAVGLPEHTEAISELDELILNAARDGVTVIAIEKTTRKVVGAAFNKLYNVKDTPSGEGTTNYLENCIKSCKYPSSRAVIQFMIDADKICYLLDYCKVDCLMEIMFLGTLPEFCRKGIAKKLCEVSIEVAKKLHNGENIKKSINNGGKMLSSEPVPQAVTAVFTSFTSQKIGRYLNFEIAETASYEQFMYEGKTYASLMAKDVSGSGITWEYKKL